MVMRSPKANVSRKSNKIDNVAWNLVVPAVTNKSFGRLSPMEFLASRRTTTSFFTAITPLYMSCKSSSITSLYVSIEYKNGVFLYRFCPNFAHGSCHLDKFKCHQELQGCRPHLRSFRQSGDNW